jgi:hypothetical protein
VVEAVVRRVIGTGVSDALYRQASESESRFPRHRSRIRGGGCTLRDLRRRCGRFSRLLWSLHGGLSGIHEGE